MDILLDTHALLWWLSDDPALGKSARAEIASTRNTVMVSAASAWEVTTKVRLGKIPGVAELAADFAGFIEREGVPAVTYFIGARCPRRFANRPSQRPIRPDADRASAGREPGVGQ